MINEIFDGIQASLRNRITYSRWDVNNTAPRETTNTSRKNFISRIRIKALLATLLAGACLRLHTLARINRTSSIIDNYGKTKTFYRTQLPQKRLATSMVAWRTNFLLVYFTPATLQGIFVNFSNAASIPTLRLHGRDRSDYCVRFEVS